MVCFHGFGGTDAGAGNAGNASAISLVPKLRVISTNACCDERSTVSMTDNSYATSLTSVQSDMASMLIGIMTVNKQERAKGRKVYKDREANREAQHKLIDDKRDKERRDDIKQMKKLEERNGNTANAILQMMQQMHQGNGQVQQ